jgi:hypothetical protein
MWFQHDGAPPHYSSVVSQRLSENHPGRWIGPGREDSVSWPARPPDLNHLDAFLWGYFETKACASAADTREELWHRIQQFASGIKNTSAIFERLRVPFSRRAELCVPEHGGHFEHL